MSGFEDSVPGEVIDISTGGEAYAPDLGGQGIGYVVAVQIQGGNDVILGRTSQNLLKKGVRNDILDDEPARQLVPRSAIERFCIIILNQITLFKLVLTHTMDPSGPFWSTPPRKKYVHIKAHPSEFF